LCSNLKCYSIFHFESRSAILVFHALDLSAGHEAVIFSRRRCVSGTTRSPISFLRWAFLGLVPGPANGLVFFLLTVDLVLWLRSQLVSRSQGQIRCLTNFSLPWFAVRSSGRAGCRSSASSYLQFTDGFGSCLLLGFTICSSDRDFLAWRR
jgi:hypothetical protein